MDVNDIFVILRVKTCATNKSGANYEAEKEKDPGSVLIKIQKRL